MSSMAKRIMFFDKTITVLVVLAVAVLVFSIMISLSAGEAEQENSMLKIQLNEMQALSQEAMQLKSIVELKEKKVASAKTTGIVPTLEKMLESLGLKAQVIRPLDKKKIDEFTEENAEVEMQDTDLNSVVNFLYQLENSPAPIKIKTGSINTAFENPDKFIMKLTLSLLSRG